ncbi:hypothetical protein ACFXKD_25915 [Nocardiopsis aegyptia]|uniref:hypothetical protein n=1 Tax=Nocardiopsis aegyptia TaxID=220378 RepID=UPI0036724355
MTGVADLPLSTPVEFGTGLLRTRVVTVSETEFTWTRAVGELAPDGFAAPAATARALLGTVPAAGGVRLLPGHGEGDSRRYTVPGRESLANRLLREGPGDRVAEAVHGVGAALRALHAAVPDRHTSLGRPRGVARLGRWLEDATGVGYADEARDLLTGRLGPRRWRLLDTWRAEHWEHAERVPSHGAPTFGAVVEGPEGTDAVLLTGEDLCSAPWTFDLGWVLGELVELRWQLGGSAARWQELVDALIGGYGRDPGDGWHRLAALRVALHLHDFTAYVGGTPAGVLSYADFLGFLIDLEGGVG